MTEKNVGPGTQNVNRERQAQQMGRAKCVGEIDVSQPDRECPGEITNGP